MKNEIIFYKCENCNFEYTKESYENHLNSKFKCSHCGIGYIKQYIEEIESTLLEKRLNSETAGIIFAVAEEKRMKIIRLLKTLVIEHPDIRIGQLIIDIIQKNYDKTCTIGNIYYIEDFKFESLLEKYINKNINKKEKI